MKKHYIQLRRRMEDADLQLKDLAAQTGIGYSTLSKKLCADSGDTWIGKEIIAICNVLHIPQEKIGYYFFPEITKEVSA